MSRRVIILSSLLLITLISALTMQIRFSQILESKIFSTRDSIVENIIKQDIEAIDATYSTNSDQIQSMNYKHNLIMISSILVFFLLLIAIIKEFAKEARIKVYTDSLTGLSNRAKLENINFTDKSLLILIDIDDFSDINSIYGMDVGDRVLISFANRLSIHTGHAEAFRLSGDTFALYYENGNFSDQEIAIRVTKMTKLMQNFKPVKMQVPATLGIAKGVECIHDACVALDIAHNKNKFFWIYNNESDYIKELNRNRLLHNKLLQAIEDDAIVPFYQPIVDLNQNIVHFEALMRLKEEDVYISPADFLDVAKKTKLYLPISRLMIKKVMKLLSEQPNMQVNINVAYDDIKNEFHDNYLENLLDKYQIEKRVTFEIVESSFMNDSALLEKFVSHFKSIGVKFAIDDFGSGYSNIQRIIELSPEYIKIDGTLVQSMLLDKRSHMVITNLLHYAKEFDIAIVAEFVCTKEIFEECKRIGIDYCQGYYFGKPAPIL